MSKPLPVLTPLHQLVAGQPALTFALLAAKESFRTRDGKPYVSCQFRDRRRTATALFWADSPLFALTESLLVGGFYKLQATLIDHPRYGLQLELGQLREVVETDRNEGFNEAAFSDRSRFNSDEMFAALKVLIETHIRDESLRVLILNILTVHEVKLKQLPATDRKFYPFPGGWLEHVLNVYRNCLHLSDFYSEHYPSFVPPLNRDLILAGAVLHDIGRLQELDPPEVPGSPAEPTVAGRLFGHIFLGRDLIRQFSADVPELKPELLLLLEHLVVSHLELPAWGSPRLPAIPEVLILHHADDLDAKLEMYHRALLNDSSAGPFTDPDPILKKPLLKRRDV